MIIFSGCKKDLNNQELPENLDIHVFEPRMDISDAKALFFIESGGGEYYKITRDNKIEIVKLINTDGTTVYDNPIDNGTIAGFGFLTGSNFIFADITNSVLWDENGQGEYYSFDKPRIIEKRTGIMSELSQTGFYSCNNRQYPFKNEREIQSSADNFFYKSGRIVFKINTSFSSEQYSPSGKEISFFRVDSKNNMVYINYDGEYILKRYSGELVSLSDMVGDIAFFYLGSDDNFYIFLYDNQNKKYILDKLTITETGQTITNIINDITNDFYPNFYSFKVNFDGAELFISSNISVGNKNYIYYEDTQTLSDKTSFFRYMKT